VLFKKILIYFIIKILRKGVVKMNRKSIAIFLTITFVLQMLFAFPVAAADADSVEYTYVMQDEDFSNYGFSEGMDLNPNKIGWGFDGSSDVKSLKLQKEGDKTYAELINGADKTFYLWKYLPANVSEMVYVKFDAKFAKGKTTIHLMSDGKPTKWPPAPVVFTYEAGKIMYGSSKVIEGLDENTWVTITVEADLKNNKVSISAVAGDKTGEVKNKQLTDLQVRQVKSLVFIPAGQSQVNITNITFGYYDSVIASQPTPPPTGEVAVSQVDMSKIEELLKNRSYQQRRMEYLNRGLVAVKLDNGVYTSWRWLGTEPADITFNLYRDGKKVNAIPIDTTNYFDPLGKEDSKYTVRAVINGEEQADSEVATVWENNYLPVPLNKPADGKMPDGSTYDYHANDCSVGDLDGDGAYEIIVKWEPSNAKDNAHSGMTGNVLLDAYKLDGTHLWRINLGPNIRAGAHYTQFMVYDLDGDGIAEVACKTADGTVDGEGNVIGDAKKTYRNAGGYILTGPEYLTVFDGRTGKAITTVDYEPPRGNVGDWGDTYGNRVDRFLACIAYLDGENPSLVMCRGYYTRTVLVAYNFKDGQLEKVWTFDSNDPKYKAFAGQGNHNLAVGDVDFDGFDEIVYGSAVIDHDGTGMHTTGLGHGDAGHLSDFDPSRPGLEYFQIHESAEAMYGFDLRDPGTGEIIWGVHTGNDTARGCAGDVHPGYPGAEAWAGGVLVSSKGEKIMDNPRLSANFMIWWDGDLLRENLDNNRIDKFDYENNKMNNLLTARDCSSNNGTKANPCLSADILGDWREEAIWRTKDSSALYIYTTTIPTDYRFYTLMHDPIYRLSIAWQNVAYNQPPHTGFYLGYDMDSIPVPLIYTVNKGKKISNPDYDPKNGGTYPIEKLKKDKSIILMVGECNAIANDTVMMIDTENPDVTPVIKDSSTLVPVRFISEAFGATVDWDDKTSTITVTQEGKEIKMVLNSAEYTINGEKKTLSVPAQTINDRTFIPLRAMAEALDKNVAWDDRGLIYISGKQVALDKDAAGIMIDQIKNSVYVEPKEVVLYTGAQLVPNQIPVVAVDASTDDGNVAQGAVDGDMETRWSGWGINQWLMVDLGAEKKIAAVAVAYFKGDQRIGMFDLEVSNDGENWTKVLTKQASSGNTLDLERFDLEEPVTARYVRYWGLGNSDNEYNSLNEFVVIGAE